MRVAMMVNRFPVISETFILNQITGLIERGHEVDIYAKQVGKEAKVHPDVHVFHLQERVRILPHIPAAGWPRIRRLGRLTLQHLRHHPLRLLKSLHLSSSSQLPYPYVQASSASLGQAPYDIVHCQFGTLGSWGMALRAIHSPLARLVVSFRGYDISSYVQEQGDHVYDPLFPAADGILTNCDFFRRRLLQLGCPTEKIRVLYSGIDCQRFPFTVREFPSDGQVRLAFVGRLVQKKGIETSIRAIAHVAQLYPQVQFNIIGEGPLRQWLQGVIDQLHMRDHIHLLGCKNQQEIIDCLQDSHLFVAPSVTAPDGNQDAPINVLKEAMAMGLPVLSTRHGGIPELVEDGVSGFLVPEYDVDQLAEKLLFLIQHPSCWVEMGSAGRHCIESRFNLHKLNDELVTIYQHLLHPEQAKPLVSPSPTLYSVPLEATGS